MGRSAYNALSATDRLDVLAAAEARTGRLPHVLEKDFWVVQTMEVLFGSPFGGDLVLKGGTSLSKAYDLIRRFSEDVDVTYDIRAFAPELVSHPDTDITGYDPLPPTRSQVKRWTRIINDRLTSWVDGTASRAVEDGFQAIGAEASGMLLGQTESFDQLLDECAKLEDRMNELMRGHKLRPSSRMPPLGSG